MIKRQYKDILFFKGTVLRLFQLQMRISFPFLRAKDLRRFLLIVRTHSFLNSRERRGYIHKVSVHLVQKYFPHDCSTDRLSCSEQRKRNITDTT